MSRLDDSIAAWARRLRLIAYLFGSAGLVMMVIGRSGAEADPCPVWSFRAMLCLGAMMAAFIGYYILSMLRMNRR